MTPRTKSGTARSSRHGLQEASRELVLPEGIVASRWPAVRDTLANMEISYDPWQEDLARVILGKRSGGKYAAGVGGVVMSIPRQVGKTFLVGTLVFALCLLEPGIKVIWTAQHTDTSDETFESLLEIADMPRFRSHIRKTLKGGGKQRIILRNGSRIEFGARESRFGRGKTKVSILVLDEFQHVSESALEDLVPTTNQGKNPLIFMMGTPPRPVDNGEAFTNKRSRALEGRSKDTLYVEMSADPDARVNDRKQWRKANPSYPSRTNVDAMRRMEEVLGSEDSFRREALGIWDETAKDTKAVEWAKWRRLTIPSDEAPTVGRVAYAVRFSVDGLVAGLAAARDPGGGLPVHVEGIEVFDMTMGIRPIVDFLVARADRAAHIVVDGKSGAELLIQALRDRGVRNKKLIVRMTPDLVTAACSGMLQALTDMGLSHIGQPLLDEQVRVAVPRKIGNYGGFGWDAPEGKHVVLFEAVTYAHHAVKTSKSRRGLGPRRGVVLT